MASVPPTVELAYRQLADGLSKVGLGTLDLMKAPWAEIERGVARLLGGPFDVRRPEHQAVSLGVGAVFGKRLVAEHGAFYAQNRESPDGFVLGFPEAIIMLSPFGAALEALSRSDLPRLEETTKEIRAALGRARLGVSAGAPLRLAAQDYERLFDPALVQLVVLDQTRLKELWETPAGTLSRNVREALDRSTQLPAEVKKPLESQLLGAFGALDPKKTLVEQMAQAGRLSELAAHLAATVEATRPAPEEFWASIVFPFMLIGAPQTFPPLDEDDRAALKEGVDPLFLYLDVVPYQFPAPDEGVLGVFGADAISAVHPAMAGLAPLRLVGLNLEAIGPALQAFDPGKSRAAFDRFAASLREQTGQAVETREAQRVLDEASALIRELRALWDARQKGTPAMRRLTEAEAAGEPALALVRKALQGPRIILV
ncbi:MAG TPA: hypothetical protein VE782_05305 [Myxococcaceae bacterium]|nr:hypothetical protein [Myxococcaceae bacterium]